MNSKKKPVRKKAATRSRAAVDPVKKKKKKATRKKPARKKARVAPRARPTRKVRAAVGDVELELDWNPHYRTKITQEMIAKASSMLLGGVLVSHIPAHLGTSPGSLYRWLTEGREALEAGDRSAATRQVRALYYNLDLAAHSYLARQEHRTGYAKTARSAILNLERRSKDWHPPAFDRAVSEEDRDPNARFL